MALKETNVEKNIQLELSKHKCRLWKNVRGLFYDKQGNPRQVGVGPNGGSDLLGYTILEIEPHMVGRKIAVFTAVEVKQGTGRPSKEQKDFVERVRLDGGKAGVAWNNEDAIEIIS